MQGIYAITNITTIKVYVGSSVNIEGRWKTHKKLLRQGVHWNTHLNNAWKKNGEKAFVFSVLEEVVDRAALQEREQHWLDKHKCYDRANGYNKAMSVRGSVTPVVSAETRRKLSDAAKRNGKTPEHIKKIADALRGKPKSEESKRKISETLTGRTLPEGHKKKISAGMFASDRVYGPTSEETKAKLSAANKGRYKVPGKPGRTTAWKLKKQQNGT